MASGAVATPTAVTQHEPAIIAAVVVSPYYVRLDIDAEGVGLIICDESTADCDCLYGNALGLADLLVALAATEGPAFGLDDRIDLTFGSGNPTRDCCGVAATVSIYRTNLVMSVSGVDDPTLYPVATVPLSRIYTMIGDVKRN